MTAQDRPRVVVTHWVHPEVASYLASFCAPVLPGTPGQVFPPATVARLAAGAAGLITGMADQVDEAFLAGCPRLRVISATLKGYDNFDASACARHGVWLAILPDLLTAPTPELAVGLIIGVMRRVAEADREMRQGAFAGWRPRLYGPAWTAPPPGSWGWGRWAGPWPPGCAGSARGSCTAIRSPCPPAPGRESPASAGFRCGK